MRPAVFALSLVALPVLGFAGTACSHSDETETPAANLADVNFEEGASDEALEALLANSTSGRTGFLERGAVVGVGWHRRAGVYLRA